MVGERRCALSQPLKWGKREPLSRNCRSLGSQQLFGRRHWRQRTTLKLGHPLTVPDSPTHPPPPPTISFPKSVARIIKLLEERRERDDSEEDGGRGRQASLLVGRATPSYHPHPCNLHALAGIYRAPTSLFFCLPSSFQFFSPCVSLFHACSSPSVLFILCIAPAKFSRRRSDWGWYGGVSEFRVSTASYESSARTIRKSVLH